MIKAFLVSFFAILLLIFGTILNLAEDDVASEPSFSVKSFVSFYQSTEGTYVEAIYDDQKLVSLIAHSYRETGQGIRTYNFFEDYFTLNLTIMDYTQPIYIDPQNILIGDTEHIKKVIMNDFQSGYKIELESGERSVLSPLSNEKLTEESEVLKSLLEELSEKVG